MYLCDIKVNFNKKFYDFFDWNKNDKIINLKKVPLYYTDNLENVIYNKVKFEPEFLNKIKDETISLNNRYNYVCILTNKTKFVAVNLNKNGLLKEISDINILDDIELNNDLINQKIKVVKYELLNKTKSIKFLTRNEEKIKNFLDKKINITTNHEQLKYLYLEEFNKKENDINVIVKDLKKLLINSWDENYIKIYNFFKVTL